MSDGVEADVADVDDVVASRDETVEQVRQHASQMARGLAVLQGGDYGSETFSTIKHLLAEADRAHAAPGPTTDL